MAIRTSTAATTTTSTTTTTTMPSSSSSLLPSPSPSPSPSSSLAFGAPPTSERNRWRSKSRSPPCSQSSLQAKRSGSHARCRVRSTPWRDGAEFASVGEGLLRAAELFHRPRSSADAAAAAAAASVAASADAAAAGGTEGVIEEEVSTAVRRAALWRHRSESSGGKLPHAVETTSILAEALLLDRLSASFASHRDQERRRGGAGFVSVSSLRLAYGAAVVRAVNGLADSVVKTRAVVVASRRAEGGGGGGSGGAPPSTSVAALCCDRLGLPDWIVDIRHDAAHNDLPSLPCLRLAAETLISYFGIRYWDAVTGASDALRAQALEYIERAGSAIAEIAGMNGQHREGGGGDMARREGDAVGESDRDPGLEGGPAKRRRTVENGGDGRSPPPPPPVPVTTMTTTASAAANTAAAATSAVVLARQFARMVPVDIGMEVLTNYLLGTSTENRVGSAKRKRGKGALVIVAMPSDWEQEKKDITNDISSDPTKEAYSSVLAEICSAWPGYAHRLLVELVNCALSVSENDEDKDEEQDNDVHMDANVSASVDVDVDVVKRLRSLVSWARYLLSRDFHSRLHPDITTSLLEVGTPATETDQRASSSQKNKKKYNRKDWTDVERSYMLSTAAPLDVLRRSDLPLNALADRCASFLSTSGGGGRDGSSDDSRKQKMKDEAASLSSIPVSSTTAAAKELLSMFEEVLEDDRVEDMGLGSGSGLGLKSINDGGKRQVLNEERNAKGGRFSQDLSSIGWTLCQSWDACAIGALPGYAS